MQAAYGFVDAVRAVVPPEPEALHLVVVPHRDWEVSDRGRRLDHVWLSPALAPSLVTAEVARAARSWESPSDHVPVTVELAV